MKSKLNCIKWGEIQERNKDGKLRLRKKAQFFHLGSNKIFQHVNEAHYKEIMMKYFQEKGGENEARKKRKCLNQLSRKFRKCLNHV